MGRKKRRATPRLLRLREELGVSRISRWFRRGSNVPEDVVMLIAAGEWEHGQRQQVRIPVPVDQVSGLIGRLGSAIGTPGQVVDGSQVPSPSGPVHLSSEGRAASSAGRRPSVDRRPHLVAVLEQRMDRVFEDRPGARLAWLRPHLSRFEVEEIEDLELAQIAELVNELSKPSAAAAARASSTST